MAEHAGLTCSSCGEALPGMSRYCPGCGGVIDASAGSPTRTLHGHGAGAATTPDRSGHRTSTSSSPSSDSDHGRFVPGTLLLGRYRILGLLGRGGMGEVYRADDLKLGQTVALKFLPPDLAQDAGRLARFHAEVRLARQVSHPSVCRVYDLGDLDGQPFLSMEYIDGEDLSTLLRRIGRLPEDKATEVARQICAGLAAAHERGVVHRDLKPGNVMIDGAPGSPTSVWPGSSAPATACAPAPPRTWRRSSCAAARPAWRATSMPLVSCCTSCTPASVPSRGRRSRRSRARATPPPRPPRRSWRG